MPKNEVVTRVQLIPPNATYTRGATITGGQIQKGSVPPSAISTQKLTAMSANIGYAKAGTVHVGGRTRSYLKMTDGLTEDGEGVLSPLFEAVTSERIRVFVLQIPDALSNTPADVAVGIGWHDQVTGFPFRVYPDGVTEITSGIIIMSSVARTLLTAGIIDLVYNSEGTYDEADTATRIAASLGIVSKYEGTQSVNWDSQTASIKVGEHEEVELNIRGVEIDSDRYGIYGVHFVSDHQGFQNSVGDLYGNVESTGVTVVVRSVGAQDGRELSELRLAAFGLSNDNTIVGYDSYISIRSTKEGHIYGPDAPAPGISFHPASIDPDDYGIVFLNGRLSAHSIDMNPNQFSGIQRYRFFPRRFTSMPPYIELDEGEWGIVDEGAGFVRQIYRPLGENELVEFGQDT